MMRRSLCRRKVIAIILAAAMCMSHATIAMADQVAAVTSVIAHEEKITSESADNGDGKPAAVVVSMTDGDKVDVKIEKNASVTDENINGGALTGVYTESTGKDSNSKNSQASVEVGGRITVQSTKAKDDAIDIGVKASATDGGDTDVNAGGNVVIESVKNSFGVNASSSSGGDTDVSIGGNVVIESAKSATGINASSQSEGDTDVSAGNVAIKNSVSAVGVNISASSGGDVQVNVHSVGVNGSSAADGIVAASYDSSSSTANAIGDVIALATGGNASGVTAYSEGSGTTQVNVDGDIQTLGDGYSTGVYSDAKGGSTEVRVQGELSSSSSGGTASGVSIVMGGGTNDVKVEKTVSAYGKINNTIENGYYDAVGIEVLKDTESAGGTAKITVGDVSALSDANIAYGINLAEGAVRDGGQLKIAVDGSVKAESPDYMAIGIYGSGGKNGSVSISVKDDVEASGIASEGVHAEASEGDLKIDIQGNIKQNGSIGQAVVYEETGDTSAQSTEINVGKDITAENTAVYVNKKSDSSHMSLEVQGTVSGGEHNIVLVGESKTENLDISVWKVDISDNKNVVETEKTKTVNNQEVSTYTRNEEAEKKINYIIKADQPTDYKINLKGTTKNAHDLDVAHEGDEVLLSVDIPEGYNVEFYDINRNSSYSIVPNGYGGAYLVVPRGGGVQVGVTLTKIQTDPEGNQNGITDNTNTQQSDDHSGFDPGSTDGNDDSSSDLTGNAYAAEKQTDRDTQAFGFIDATAAAAILGIQISGVDATGSGTVLYVGDVLKPVDKLTAISNFAAAGSGTLGTENIMGAGVVSFNGAFAGAASDTVELPVPVKAYAGREYTVVLSDGTTISVQCLMDGVLNIPFGKNAAGLTFIIYDRQMNPANQRFFIKYM